MSVNLQKGQKVSLTKDNPTLSKIVVGLGWDAAERKSGGLLGGLFGKTPANIDCDASVFMLNQNGQLVGNKSVIYFGNLKSTCGGVVHTGDNLTGDGDGDDEQIIVELNKISPNIHRLLFTVNIYDCIRRHQDFGMIKNAFIRVVDVKSRKELIRYNLSDDYSGRTSLMVGELYRHNGEWKFSAIGEGTNDTGLQDIVNRLR
ncbi:MAG: TerD family protein [Clostridium argentinense]|uniref:TerD family protein n=1 Tax=Clostridium faecium TaxID=2762223 RepID=A0ABR8YTD4_9CLOT|nr:MULTISPECIES: TerD family protein [Clostridium]MBD8047527.1 TerD family protein [Clostridium faecium]MBS5823843.1 TerD family protein [Clostridium argentinense]MDU1348785.1 TerD family protein [Clostridium argentinense]